MNAPPHPTLLVIGAARSGKSTFAQSEVEACGRTPVFVATGQAFDEEMTARIAAHAASRGRAWRTLESPFDLAETLEAEAKPARVLLVDCLTLWLSNIMLRGDDVEAASDALLRAVGRLGGPAVFVTNEVGAGIVPDNALGRRFRDAQGRLNQRMATLCQTVVVVTAGLPLTIKPAPWPVPRFRP